jgi:hypothetical protein
MKYNIEIDADFENDETKEDFLEDILEKISEWKKRCNKSKRNKVSFIWKKQR